MKYAAPVSYLKRFLFINNCIIRNMDIIIADRIKELMKEEKLNQTRLAEKIGVKQNTISAWVLGKKEPSIKSLWLLADYFNVDIDYLVGRKDFF